MLSEVIYDANMHLKDGQQIHYPKEADDVVIEFDEKILELALTNLVHNAVKYSGENTNVYIDIQQDEKQLFITIRDQGIGIPEHEQKFIFNRYFRAENALLNAGTGIGLNIVKSHIENLGGSLTFKSILNQGSTFTIMIPTTQN